jgi:hypothetical protein
MLLLQQMLKMLIAIQAETLLHQILQETALQIHQTTITDNLSRL